MGLSRSCLCVKGFLSRFLLGLALESSFVFVEWNDVSHQMHQGINFDTMTQADYSITLGMCLPLHNLTSSFKVTGGCLPPVILCHLFCKLASHWSGHEGKLQGAAGCSQASAGSKNPPGLHAAVGKTTFLLPTPLHSTLTSLPALHLYSFFCSCWYSAQLILSDRLAHLRWGPSFHIYILALMAASLHHSVNGIFIRDSHVGRQPLLPRPPEGSLFIFVLCGNTDPGR